MLEQKLPNFFRSWYPSVSVILFLVPQDKKKTNTKPDSSVYKVVSSKYLNYLCPKNLEAS